MELTTIILLALVLVVLYFAYTTFVAPTPVPVEEETTEREEVQQREYTLEELHQNNGVTNKKILISVCGQGTYMRVRSRKLAEKIVNFFLHFTK